ncbi:MAG: hypothetical protein ACR2PR_08645 [Pseudohongiellaceae bacterium]
MTSIKRSAHRPKTRKDHAVFVHIGSDNLVRLVKSTAAAFLKSP